jgi:endonuclease G
MAERAQLADYKRSGWSRGHMAPAADMPDAQSMAQSFSLANMVPQAPLNNQKPWAGIEQATRKYVMRAKGDVYVITGPVFDDNSETIGPSNVRVPKYLFKLVYDESSNRAWAHWIENTDEARAGRPISYEELVRRTRIEFLPGLAVQH